MKISGLYTYRKSKFTWKKEENEPGGSCNVVFPAIDSPKNLSSQSAKTRRTKRLKGISFVVYHAAAVLSHQITPTSHPGNVGVGHRGLFVVIAAVLSSREKVL